MPNLVADSFWCASGGVIAAGRYFAPAGWAVSISTPLQYQMHQRDGSNQASVAITGAYTGATTGIEARFNGGAWTTICATPTGGSYSGTLTNCPMGQGNLEVRFANAHAVTSSKALIGVGDIYVVSGQSNNRGQANAAIQPANVNSTAVQMDASGTWVALIEVANSSVGNYLGALATKIDAKGIPVGFINCAIGSTEAANWVPGQPNYNSMLARANAAGGHVALLWWQGESDTGTAQATFESRTNSIINGWFSDTGKKTLLQKICLSGLPGGAATVRAGQANVIASNTHIFTSADMNVWTTSSVHYSTTQEVTDVANTLWAGLQPVAYP